MEGHNLAALCLIIDRCHYSSGFLSAMLECVKAEVDLMGCVLAVEDAKNTTVLANLRHIAVPVPARKEATSMPLG